MGWSDSQILYSAKREVISFTHKKKSVRMNCVNKITTHTEWKPGSANMMSGNKNQNFTLIRNTIILDTLIILTGISLISAETSTATDS